MRCNVLIGVSVVGSAGLDPQCCESCVVRFMFLEGFGLKMKDAVVVGAM